MGRPKKQIDDANLLKMRGEGKFLKEISEEMLISTRTLSRRIAYLQYQEGLLTRYRSLQGLNLTELQARILEEVDLKNFEGASLIDLLNTFKVLKKMEIVIEGKSSSSYKIKGLIDHLLFIEKVGKHCALVGKNPTKK